MDSENQQTPTAEKRCVIYCRKSSSDGLDRDYTSIDCQTDTCKAYIERHAGEGWRFTGRVYADGGFSGGTTNRPEFQKMMDSVRAGEVDVVVIYKLDRISRNKRDFWNLVHEFRQYNVTIVTATQFVEMQTSGGRAATGVLMDFAEYEREIDSERINGQIRAARMAGRWASAATPYGYAKTQHAELVVDEEAAKRVRFIFERYLVIKSARQVAIELNERFGDKELGKPWRTANVYRILENIAYKGYVMYKDREYKGIHTPLVTEEVWAKAREIAAENTVCAGGERRIVTIAEFKGILKCGHCGGAMAPTFTNKRGRRYVYYKCQKDDTRAVSTCPIRSIASNEIERPVWNEIGRILRTQAFQGALAAVKPELAAKAGETALGDLAGFIEQLYPVERSRVVHALIKEIRLTTGGLDIVFRSGGATGLAEEMRNDNV